MLCLVTQIVSQAIFDEAFDPPFQSLDEILNRPNLEHTDVLDLHWKADKLKDNIFPVTYAQYWENWNRLWLVSGNRDPPRPYSLRVGAGGKLDGEP
jgi:hypothetical protein